MMTAEENNKKILDARAKTLAKVIHESTNLNAQKEVTVFTLGTQKYAFDSLLIKEIVPLPKITVLPCVPAFVAGIMNLRGKIISVLYLDKLLHRVDELRAQQQVIILKNSEMEFGLLVDEINGVEKVDERELQESVPTLSETSQRYFSGIRPDHLIILDALKMLNDPATRVNDEVL